MHREYDIIVIGAGVVGLLVCYKLSRFRLRVACVEKEDGAARGASGNNSGVIHSGINLKPGSLKARFCVQGNSMMYDLCRTLNVPCRMCGTVVAAQNDADMKILEEMTKRAELNGVEGIRLLGAEEVKKIEPHVSAVAGLVSPHGGITDPKMLCSAAAGASRAAGVDLFFDSKVVAIDTNDTYGARLEDGNTLSSRVMINSAGLYSDDIARMVGLTKHRIHPWLGEYYVIDSSRGHLLNSMVYPAPQFGAGGLGIHLTKSLDGRIFVGPNATYLRSKEERIRTPVEDFYSAVAKFLPELSIRDLQYGHAGVRTKLNGPETRTETDFVIEEYPDNFLHLLGIESPGLTASPALAEHVCELAGKMTDLKPK